MQVTASDGQYQAIGRVVVRVLEAGNDDPDPPEVTVLPANYPPQAVDDEADSPEDTPTVIDVLSNDHDPDGD